MVKVHRWVPLLSLIGVLTLAWTGGAQNLQLPTIVTVGVGSVVVDAEQVVVPLTIETQEESANEAYARNLQIRTDIQEALTAFGLEGLQFRVSGINLWQQRATAIRPQSTYRTTSTLTVILAHEGDVGLVVDTAMGLGAAAVQGVRFQSPDLRTAAETARALAVADAMAKAEVIAKATETRIVTMRRVTDADDVYVYNPSDPLLLEGRREPLRYPAEVERGQILVQVEVTMEFDVASR